MNGNKGGRRRGHMRHKGNVRARDLERDMEEEQGWERIEVGVGHGGLMRNQDSRDRRRDERGE